MYKILKELSFLLKVFYIFSSEFIMYLFLKNYSKFIDQLTQRLANINILYVKIFQAIALNNSLIDDYTNNKLLKFTDNAPWNLDDIRYYKLIELESKYDLKIINGYETPINSGMISLVYKAYKRSNGELVIIKMKRNDIDVKLNNAIENLKTFMYILSFIPIINRYKISDVVNKNIDIIRHQTNFNEEVDNILRIKQNCKNLKYVKIPEVYKEVTDEYSDFIMMEYIEGKKINEIDVNDYDEYAKQILKFGFVTTLLHGFTHGDLHSGNILFIKDDNEPKYKLKIGIIDFGIMFDIERQYKEDIFDIVTTLFEIPAKESGIKILNSSIMYPPNIIKELPKEQYEGIVDSISEVIEKAITSKNANQFDIYRLLSVINDYFKNSKLISLGIRPSDSTVKTQLVLAMAQGVTLALCKGDYMIFANQVINELFHTELLQ
jgi:predicted unusual protein kinase regulating ubiquinone biosynthesis (AarF/ABC1/UbiB family)